MSDLSRDLGRDKPDAWTRLRELEQRDADVRTLDEWTSSHEIDGHADLTCGHGDATYWLLALSRESIASDPEELEANELSFYSEDGMRVWEFEGETAEEARAKAAAWVREQRP